MTTPARSRLRDAIHEMVADLERIGLGTPSLREAVQRLGKRVHVPEVGDVKAIRRATGLSQAGFAERFGFDLASIRNWEQGKRIPRGPARALLAVVAHAPETVFAALDARE